MGGLVKQRMVCTGNFLIVILLFPLLTFNSALSYLLGFFFRFISKYHILLSQITNQKKIIIPLKYLNEHRYKYDYHYMLVPLLGHYYLNFTLIFIHYENLSLDFHNVSLGPH